MIVDKVKKSLKAPGLLRCYEHVTLISTRQCSYGYVSGCLIVQLIFFQLVISLILFLTRHKLIFHFTVVSTNVLCTLSASQGMTS